MSSDVEIVGSGAKYLNRHDMIGLVARALGSKNKVLLICDVGDAKCEEETRKYVDALNTAELMGGQDAAEKTISDLQIVVIPFNSLQVAEDVYRSIPHASHFVSLWVEGELYGGAC